MAKQPKVLSGNMKCMHSTWCNKGEVVVECSSPRLDC